MKNTIVTGSLIVFSDGFVWKRLSNEKAYKIWVSAENEDFELYFDYGLPINNVIYYPHTNTLSFNWNDYGGKITQEEFDDFVNNVDRSQLPEGIKFELK